MKDHPQLIEPVTFAIQPSRTEAERFLKALDPNATRFTFQTFDDDPVRKKANEELHHAAKLEGRKKIPPKDPFARLRHGTLDQHWDELVRWNADRVGIFVTANATDFNGRKKQNIVGVRVLFVDLDGAPLDPVTTCTTPPHIVVETSTGKWHAYWLVSDVPLEQFTSLQKALIARFNSDKAVHDLPRVMRLPGTVHRKDQPFLSVVQDIDAQRPPYTLQQMLKAFPTVEPTPKVVLLRSTDSSNSFWSKVNALAYEKRDAWVPVLFPTAQYDAGNDLYRVSSAALGRSNQEDLVIYSNAIKDFGVHDLDDPKQGPKGKPGGRTPIALVVEWGGVKDATAAALRLCDRCGVDPETLGWVKSDNRFELNDKKRPHPNQRNIVTALNLLDITLRHDVFSDRMTIAGLSGFDLLDDSSLDRLWLLVEQRFRFLPTKEFFRTVVTDVARQNAFHPVRDYLDGLTWDGTARIDKWLVTYGNAKNTPYVRAVGAITLIAAVRRVRQPGCKFDELLILESKQGKDKSKTLEQLAVNQEWYSDDLPLGVDTQQVIEQTRGIWIVEAAELSGMGKRDVGHLKAMLSRRVDRARMSYARMTTEKRREFIAIGTTNEKIYLRDLTGNRRFWPVEVEFDVDVLSRDRDQLWAEAAAREARGESIRLDPKLWKSAAKEQQQRTVEDPWIDIVSDLLGDRKGKLLAADVWTLVNLRSGQVTQEHFKRMGAVMQALGWKHTKLRFGTKPANCYCRGTGELERILVYRSTPDGHVSVSGGDDPTPTSQDPPF